MNPKESAVFDQSLAAMSERVPPLLFVFYRGCVRDGFSEQQAMDLTRAFLGSLVAGAAERKSAGEEHRDT